MASEVLIYTASYCPYCAAAKKLLQSKKIAYREIDVSDDDAMRAKLVDRTGGRETVPQIFVDGKPIGGYDDLVKMVSKGEI
ncbi:MAG: glutaredoxin 3 [Candidatus Omnitrophica bacterium]|nr:glutaredoxin 3 [Candidatus Omnitrophota bacterium]